MIGAALTLAKKGLCVFPCRPRRKEPATDHGCLDATIDLELIRRWWREVPEYNVAIATGSCSGVFVVDLDNEAGEAALRKLELEHGELPATVEVITARGRHLYFKMPDIPLRNTAGKIAPGVDTRADGGYVLAPPSIHPSGRRYAWSVDSATTFAAAPAWLLDKINERTNRNCRATCSAEWRELIGGVGEGQRNATITRLAGYLLRRQIDPFVALEILTAWNATRCTPPLPVLEVERVLGSICKRELRRKQAENG